MPTKDYGFSASNSNYDATALAEPHCLIILTKFKPIGLHFCSHIEEKYKQTNAILALLWLLQLIPELLLQPMQQLFGKRCKC